MQNQAFIIYKCIKPTVQIDEAHFINESERQSLRTTPESMQRTTIQIDPIIDQINTLFQNEDVKISSFPISTIVPKIESEPNLINDIIYADLNLTAKELGFQTIGPTGPSDNGDSSDYIPLTDPTPSDTNDSELVKMKNFINLDADEPEYQNHRFYVSKLDSKLACGRIDILAHIYNLVYIVRSIFQYPHDQKFYIICDRLEVSTPPKYLLPTNIANIIDILYFHYTHIYSIALLSNAFYHQSVATQSESRRAKDNTDSKGTSKSTPKLTSNTNNTPHLKSTPTSSIILPSDPEREYASYVKSLIQRLKKLGVQLT